VIFLVQGNTLFQSLALNLVRYPDDGFFVRRSGDRPAWEMDDPYTPERSVPLGYLDYLTWQNRRILLLPEAHSGGIRVRQMTVAPGLRLDGTVLDTMKHYRQDERRGPLPRRFNEDRALWRDSAALFKLHSGGWRPPVTFDWLAELVHMGVLSKTLTERTLALGMANNQAKVEFYRSERLPLPLAYLQDRSFVESLDTALGMAEDVGRRLWGAGRRLATYLLSPVADAPDARQPKREDLDQVMGPWGIERIYWSRLEVEFRTTIERIPRDTEGALDAWQTVLRRTAWDAIEHAARLVGTNPRGFKAIVRAREQLALGLSLLFPRDDRQDVLAESSL
jgi:CRISPR system Cascade subunit CasA